TSARQKNRLAVLRPNSRIAVMNGMVSDRRPLANAKPFLAPFTSLQPFNGSNASTGNRSVMAGTARHSLRPRLGSWAYRGAHGVSRAALPAGTDAFPQRASLAA